MSTQEIFDEFLMINTIQGIIRQKYSAKSLKKRHLKEEKRLFSVLIGHIGIVLGMIRAFAALAQSGAPDAFCLASSYLQVNLYVSVLQLNK